MVLLFAAPDRSGILRFVSEVPRGAASNCFCPTCGAPLIARQGQEKEWHFAHTFGERPECTVGALNLLRRLAKEYLVALPLDRLRFQPYATSLPGPAGAFLRPAAVSWEEQPHAVLEWMLDDAHDAPVAKLDLGQGLCGWLYLGIGEVEPRAAPGPGATGRFFVPLPPAHVLRDRASLAEYFAAAGVFVWDSVPDRHGLIAREQQRLQAIATERAAFAGRKWASIRAGWGASRTASAEPGLDQPSGVTAPPSAASVRPAPAFAPGGKPGCTFQFRKLHDGSRWVLYEAVGGGQRLAPYPDAFEGWEEFFPARIGHPAADGSACLEVLSLDALLMFFRDKTEISRITGNPADFANL